VGEVLSWTDLPSNGIISAANGDKIVVAEVDRSTGQTVKAGQALAIVPASPTNADFLAVNSGTDESPDISIYLSPGVPAGTYKLRQTTGGEVVSTFEYDGGAASAVWTTPINFGKVDGVKKMIYTNTPEGGTESEEIDDGVMPLSPTAAAIDATLNNNDNYISNASKGAPVVRVSAAYVDGNAVYADLMDQHSHVSQSPIPAHSSDSTYIINMADASHFTDGDDITVRAYIIDSHGNQSGYYYGTSGKADFTLPIITADEATITAGNYVTIQSSEVGTVYLLPYDSQFTTQTELETAVCNSLAAKTTVSQANTNTSISTSGLTPGQYKAVSVDAAGNLSVNVTGKITIL
jgi:hypothetical protein